MAYWSTASVLYSTTCIKGTIILPFFEQMKKARPKDGVQKNNLSIARH
jgi:hypothetical protein